MSGGKKILPRQTPTMSDVAARAGVSKMTVSRTLKEGGTVAPETRRRIMSAVDEIGYVLDLSAGGLSSKRTGFVAVLIPSINNSNFADTARGLTVALAGNGLQLLLGYTDYAVEREEVLLESMLRRRPEGVIVTGGAHSERCRRMLENCGVPVIETWDLPVKPVQHVVGFSNADAAGTLVRYLHGKGYRNIAFIGGTSNRDTRGADRRAGYEKAIAELSLPAPRIISFGTPPISMRQGGEAIVRLIEQWPEAEAAICVSDLSAFGAIMECHRRKWAVPQRIAIAGFGNFEIASCSHPPITTVDVGCYEIGHQAGSLLVRAVEGQRAGKPIAAETIITDYAVISRESA